MRQYYLTSTQSSTSCILGSFYLMVKGERHLLKVRMEMKRDLTKAILQVSGRARDKIQSPSRGSFVSWDCVLVVDYKHSKN